MNDEPSERPEFASVKIDAQTYQDLRVVAAWKGRAVADYLSEVVSRAIEPELQKMASEIGRRAAVPSAKEKPETKGKINRGKFGLK